MNNLKNSISNEFNKEKNYQKIQEKIKKEKNSILTFKYQNVIAFASLFIIGLFIFNTLENKSFKDKININLLEDDIYLINKTRNLDKHIKETNNLENEYKFINELKIPNDLKNMKEYIIYIENYINNYQIEYSLNKKSISISWSNKNDLTRNYLNEIKQNYSIINKTKINIYKYDYNYIATFKYNNINFDIETNNINENELISLIKSIVR